MLSTQMIGNKIAEARKKIDVSQAQLAERLFISSQAVGKWERGESMPDIITLNRLAEILGVDLNYFSESEERPDTEFDASLLKEFSQKPTAEEPTEKQKKKLSWNMSGGNWVDADFSGLKNLHDKFSSSNIQRCLFIGSDLSGLLLSGNNLDNCDFSSSDISNSQFKRSNIANNQFKDCSLNETEFSGSYISACDFTNADFTGVTIKSGGMEKNNVSNALWNRTSFASSHVADMVFNSKIEDCSFENCSFKRVTFQNATLINTFFKNTDLKRTKFVDCQVDRITYEFLKHGKADLTSVTLITE
ncbi:MAG: pentapeptide repeat-containing protein [Bacteroidota bacterium]